MLEVYSWPNLLDRLHEGKWGITLPSVVQGWTEYLPAQEGEQHKE